MEHMERTTEEKKRSMLRHLAEVIDLLGDESRWTRDWFARNRFNTKVTAHSEDACSWCLVGGIMKASSRVSCPYDSCNAFLKELADHIARTDCKYARHDSTDTITTFNDHPFTTHADVMRELRAFQSKLITDEVGQ